MNNKFYVGRQVSSFEEYDVIGPVTGVTLSVDEENYYESGNDSGYMLELDCPYGSQQMADEILSQIEGYSYKGYRAENAVLDMGAELGDGITVNGIYSMLAHRVVTFGPGHMSEISAPGSSEIEHEYTYVSSTQREIERKIATTRSLIEKTAEEILLQVEGISGEISRVNTKVDSITLEVSNGETSSTITLMAGDTEIKSETIQMTGVVTFNGLESGQTTINGGWIEAETITGDKLVADTVVAGQLRGSEISLIDEQEHEIGEILLEESTSILGQRKVTIRSGAVEIQGTLGDIWLENNTGQYIHMSSDTYGTNDIVVGSGHIRSDSDGMYDCGGSQRYWDNVWAYNSSISASDLTIKKDVVYGLEAYDDFFDGLQPMSYRFINGKSGRRHIGLGAQDVERSLFNSQIDSRDFAGFIKAPRINEDSGEFDGEYRYALRYGEFISINIWQIQQLKKRVGDLEKMIYGGS